MKTNNTFLFSIDLEDVRENVENKHLYKDRVIENTQVYLNWLKQYQFKCTFFTVGKVAEEHPELIQTIISEGHEIACHSYLHIPVATQKPDEFKNDLDKNIKALQKAGAKEIKGYRAPIFSIDKRCEWAYDIMKEFGITYSSSVLPAKNPLYGWPEFGQAFKKLPNGIIEFPISLAPFGPLNIPFAGGVYFRALPQFFLLKSFKNYFQNNQPALSYFHPYDLDTKQEHFMHAGINNNKFFNWLMYYNRKNLIKRLDKVIALKANITTYSDFISTL